MKFMNKTQQLLKSREEEFDKEFGEIAFWNQNTHKYELQKTAKHYKRSKSFNATTLSLLLNSLKEEIDLMVDIGALAAGTPEAMEHNVGWENCKHHISTLLSETISNIQTK